MANDVDILLNALGEVESKGTGGYAAKNPKTSASGKYQFMFSQWGDKIRQFANNPNLTEEEFRSNPQLQEDFAKYYAQSVLTPEAEKLQKRHGSKLKQRDVLDIEDAQSLIHFQGYPNAVEYLKTGKTANPKENKKIQDYLKQAREIRSKLREGKGVSMAAKTPTEGYSLEELMAQEPKETSSAETTTQAEAAARGIAQGISFGFADEITAALESAVTGKPYEQSVEESRKAYETSAKEYPKTTFGAYAVGGAASMLIPGVGVVGRTAQTVKAAQAYKAAVAAGDALVANAAKKILTKELVRGGAQTGALAGLGEAKGEGALETASSTGLGAISGGALGVAVPRGIEKIAKSELGQAVGKGITTAKEAIKSRLPVSGRWQIPEFAAQPENQARVDEIVVSGKKTGLTDRQILNEIAVEFPEVPTQSLEQAFREPGIKGAIKRGIAGSQEAAEFIDRPEQLERAERIKAGQTPEMARLKKGIGQTQEELQKIARTKEQMKSAAGENIDQLKNDIADLVDRYKSTADETAKMKIEDQIAYAKEQLRLSTGISQKKANLKKLNDIDRMNALSVSSELEKLGQTRSSEQLQKVNQLRDNLNDQVEQLAQQRSNLVTELDKVKTTDDLDLGTYDDILNQIKQNVEDNGMGDYWSQIRQQAFTGDPRINKVNAYNKYLSDRKEYLKGVEEFKNGLRPEAPLEPTVVEPPTKGDIVGALITANQKISKAEFGTPLAKVKRNLAEIIQENMGAISPEAYAIQRQLSQTRSHLSTIEKSPFFEARAIPVVGRTGRVATAPKKFIKTELPDISKASTDYKKILKGIGVDIDEVEKAIDINRQARASVEKTMPNIELQQQIGQEKTKLGRLQAQRSEQDLQQQLIESQLAAEKGQKTRDIRKQIREKRANIKRNLQGVRGEEMRFEDYLQNLKERESKLGETEAQLYSTLREAEGIPASIRDVGQAAVIGAKGQVPFSIGKVLIPTPKTRIQAVNKIKSRFANPSLTSAVRVAIERPITMETVRSLSTTHKVSEPDLIKTLQESGVDVLEDEQSMKALPLESGQQIETIEAVPQSKSNIKITKDRYGNTVIEDLSTGEIEIISPSAMSGR